MDHSAGCASVRPRAFGLPPGQLEGAGGVVGAFGLPVQGTDGHSFVFLNRRQQQTVPGYGGSEVTFVEHYSVCRSTGGGCAPELPLRSPGQAQLGGSHPDLRVAPSPVHASSPQLNYQRHPELLLPYHPQNNSLDLGSSRGPHPPPPSPASPSTPLYSLVVHKARVPLPLSGRERDRGPLPPQVKGYASSRGGDCAQPVIGGSDDREAWSRSQRRDEEERRRSRSADSSASTNSVATVIARTVRADVGGGASAPVSPKPPITRMGRSPGPTGTAGAGGTQRPDAPPGQKNPRFAPVLLKMETTESNSICQSRGQSTSERDSQVTPDLLEGQRQLSPKADSVTEDSAKQALFTYLKHGSVDTDDVIRRKVKIMFEKIHSLRCWGSDKLEEMSVLELQASQLKKQLEEEVKRSRSSAEIWTQTEQERRSLEEELRQRQEEQQRLQLQLRDKERELHNTLLQLQQVRREREQLGSEVRDLQEQLSEMHDELDKVKQVEAGERQNIMEDLMQLKREFQEVQGSQEVQEEVLRRKERELTALRGALEEEVAVHAEEVTSLRETHEQELQRLKQEARQVSEEVQEEEVLFRQVQELENRVAQLTHLLQEAERREKQLGEQTHTLLEEKKRLEVCLEEVKQQEEDLCGANQALMRHLEDTQAELRRMSQEHKELQQRLKEEGGATEEMRKRRSQMEEERRRQDRVMEQLQEEMCRVVAESERATLRLQEQVDEARRHTEGERTHLLQQLQGHQHELHTHNQHNHRLRKEITQLEAELQQCEKHLEEAELKTRKLEKKVKELEEENRSGQEDRGRLNKLLETRVAQLEVDLKEERTNEEQLMQRLERGREQMEQTRAELLQEKALRQDLECDKMCLERQNRDLKSRVSHLEGSQRSGQDGLVARMEERIQELEARLEGEERESGVLQQANRKLERKLKEIMMQVGEEQLSLKDQRDQLSLRLKTLKRQLDEAEEEIERLEASKRKIQRELDEQLEANQQLHTHITELRADIRRKRRPVLMTLDDEEEEREEEDGGSD